MRKLKQMENYVLVACSSEDKVPIGKQSSHFGGWVLLEWDLGVERWFIIKVIAQELFKWAHTHSSQTITISDNTLEFCNKNKRNEDFSSYNG